MTPSYAATKIARVRSTCLSTDRRMQATAATASATCAGVNERIPAMVKSASGSWPVAVGGRTA